MSLKETIGVIGKKFITELSLEYKHDTILAAVYEFCKPMTPATLKQFIEHGKPPSNLASLISFLSGYKELVKEYSIKALAEKFAELICEARPDLEETFYNLGDQSGAWLFGCAELIRNRVLNPSQFMENDEPEIVEISCDNCGKSMRISRSDAEALKQCPFCGTKED